jgi:hypothetical protein
LHEKAHRKEKRRLANKENRENSGRLPAAQDSGRKINKVSGQPIDIP